MAKKYPTDWEKRRRLVYRRDDYECGNCGSQGGPYGDAELHAHHVVPVKKGGSHATTNLVTMCKSCHETIHGHGVGGRTRRGKSHRSKKKSGSYASSNWELTVSDGAVLIGMFTAFFGMIIWATIGQYILFQYENAWSGLVMLIILFVCVIYFPIKAGIKWNTLMSP